VKLRSGAVEVAARIFWCDHEPGEPENKLERPFLDAEINAERVPPSWVWERRGRAITEADYRYLIALGKWAREHAPHEPAANPREAVDWLTAPIPSFDRRK
jgi:hypothetical protein